MVKSHLKSLKEKLFINNDAGNKTNKQKAGRKTNYSKVMFS